MGMISEQEKLSGFKSKMDSLATLYNEFKEKDFVTAESLNGLPDVFKEMNDGKDFDIFSKIVGDPTSGKEKIQGAFNDMVGSYIKEQNILDGTTSETKGAVIANLEDAGIQINLFYLFEDNYVLENTHESNKIKKGYACLVTKTPYNI